MQRSQRPESAAPTRSARPSHKILATGSVLSFLLAGLAASSAAPLSAAEARTATSRLVHCRLQAAERYDEDRYTIAELARRIIRVCAAERANARIAHGLSADDPTLDADDFAEAVEIVEDMRKHKRK